MTNERFNCSNIPSESNNLEVIMEYPLYVDFITGTERGFSKKKKIISLKGNCNFREQYKCQWFRGFRNRRIVYIRLICRVSLIQLNV